MRKVLTVSGAGFPSCFYLLKLSVVCTDMCATPPGKVPKIITLAASSEKRNVTVWPPSVRPSVRLSVPPFFITLIQRAAHTRRD